MAPSRLPTLGLLLLLSVGVCLSSETNVLRQIRSLTSHLRTLRKVADDARRARFVGQLASDCGLNCKRDNDAKTELQAKGVEDQVQQAKKRFMSLGAADCEDFQCLVRKRLAMEKVKRFLMEKQERLVPQNSGKRRHRRYLDILLNNPGPYDTPSQPSSNYGSYGWNHYGNSYGNYGSSSNYGNSYYDDDYNYYDDDDYYDYSASGSGSGHNENDAE